MLFKLQDWRDHYKHSAALCTMQIHEHHALRLLLLVNELNYITVLRHTGDYLKDFPGERSNCQ